MKISEIPKWIIDAVAEINDCDDDNLEDMLEYSSFRQDIEVVVEHYLRSIGDDRWRNLRIVSDE